MSIATAELTCGCAAPSGAGRLLSLADAVALARSMASPLHETERVDLRDAVGRTLAIDLRAPGPMPFFDNSAMDGFAVACTSLKGCGPWELPVIATIPAGSTAEVAPMVEAVAVRIFTGAPVPPGFDAVIMQEACADRGDRVVVTRRPAPGDNIRRQGTDIGRGALLVPAGTMLDARHVGLLAANGHGTVNVVRKVRIAIFSTGNEVVEPGVERGTAAVYDANRPMLLALAATPAASVSDFGIIADSQEDMSRLMASLPDRCDIAISTGAVSVGGCDLVRPAFERAGGTIRNWRVAIKPGKPVMLGRLGTALYTGLPGNPLAAYVGYRLFADAQIATLAGRSQRAFGQAAALAGFNWRRPAGRAEFFPARVSHLDPSGLPVIERLGNGGSGTLHALASADGIGLVAAQTQAVKCGDPIAWEPF